MERVKKIIEGVMFMLVSFPRPLDVDAIPNHVIDRLALFLNEAYLIMQLTEHIKNYDKSLGVESDEK